MNISTILTPAPFRILVLAISLSSIFFLQVSAQTTWDGAGDPNLDWSNNVNWLGDVAPSNDGTATIVFNGNSGLAPVVDQAWNVDRIEFRGSDIGNFTLSGETITLTPSSSSDGIRIYNDDFHVSEQTINNNIILGADTAIMASSVGATPAGQILRLNGNINLQSNVLLYHAAGHSNGGEGVVELGGVISGTGIIRTPQSATRPQVLRLLGDNTFSGGVDVQRTNRSTIQVGHDNALGSGNFTVRSFQASETFTFEAYQGPRTLANNFIIGTGNAGENEDQPFIFSGDFTLNGSFELKSRNSQAWRPFEFDGTTTLNGNLTQADEQETGGVSPDMQLRVQGDGTFILNGDASHQGATYVGREAGGDATTLVVNGELTNSPSVTVRSDATLRGNGNIGHVIVQSGGTLRPGNSVGTLTTSGDVDLLDNSFFQIDLGAGSGESSQLVVGGVFEIGDGVTLDLAGMVSELVASNPYTIVGFDNPQSDYGEFTHLLLNGSSVDWSNSGLSVVYGSDGIIVIPEPSTAVVLIGFVAGVFVMLRRRIARCV